jgi:hypothetical protein
MNFALPWNSNKPSDKLAASIDDIKSQVGLQFDRLSRLASDVGRDVAAQAAQVSQDTGAQVGTAARDIGSQAAKASQDARTQAAAAARDVPVVAGVLAQQALKGARQLGRDLRQVRITKEPPKQQRGPDVMPGIALLAGVGSGLAIMYFFDPNEGRRRRALFRDQVVKWTRIGREQAAGKAKDLQNRAVGVMYEARKQVSKTDLETESMAGTSRSQINGNGGASLYESQEPVTSEIV